MSEAEALEQGMKAHSECHYAEIYPALTRNGSIWAVCLWPDETARRWNTPPKYVEHYPRTETVPT